jgi:hypothetical protein
LTRCDHVLHINSNAQRIKDDALSQSSVSVDLLIGGI